jgi:hypothetical protein
VIICCFGPFHSPPASSRAPNSAPHSLGASTTVSQHCSRLQQAPADPADPADPAAKLRLRLMTASCPARPSQVPVPPQSPAPSQVTQLQARLKGGGKAGKQRSDPLGANGHSIGDRCEGGWTGDEQDCDFGVAGAHHERPAINHAQHSTVLDGTQCVTGD